MIAQRLAYRHDFSAIKQLAVGQRYPFMHRNEVICGSNRGQYYPIPKSIHNY